MHTGQVTSLDWSVDCLVSTGNELVFHIIDNKKWNKMQTIDPTNWETLDLKLCIEHKNITQFNLNSNNSNFKMHGIGNP